MKSLITKALGKYSDDSAIGEVHLHGAIDSFACGLANEDYEAKASTKPITCPQCKTFLAWAKIASKIKD